MAKPPDNSKDSWGSTRNERKSPNGNTDNRKPGRGDEHNNERPKGK